MATTDSQEKLHEQRFFSCIANSIDQYGLKALPHSINTMQLSSGPFVGKSDAILHPDLSIIRRTTNQLIYQKGVFNSGYVCFTLHPSDHCCYSKGNYSGMGHVSIQAGLSEWEVITKANTMHYVLLVKVSSLSKHLAPDLHAVLQAFLLTENRIELFTEGFYDVAKRVCDRSLHASSFSGSHNKSDSVFGEIRSDIFHIIGFLLRNGQVEQVRSNSKVRLLDKALGLIGEGNNCQLKVSDVADSLHTTRRALEKVFEIYLNISPKEYMNSIRLSVIQAELIGGDRTQGSIAEIARRHGLTHMGHFSRAYAKLFNELPSETVARAKNNRLSCLDCR
ncbi:hypothetical protein NBRC116494_01770 [Aurantivibrio plasticivorans]